MLKKYFSLVISTLFFFQSLYLPDTARAEILPLPAANQMLALSAPLNPVMLQGLRYNPNKPFEFEFILQQGDKAIPLDQLRDRGMELVRYFMAALTMPEEELWVNLSPYEHSRIIPTELGTTRLGADMLIEDYILKQLASSLTFPDSQTGRAFWQKIYTKTLAYFGTDNIPVSTFNKVWIIPDYAQVLVKENTVIVTYSHLKVMMEQDYLAQKKHILPDGKNVASDVMRQVIIPILEKEVNTGSNFAPLRQMFDTIILAEWYKRNLKESLFNQYYANQHKIKGIDEISDAIKEKIYQRYVKAYKKGVYNLIREDTIPGTGEIIPRKYFSGGESFAMTSSITDEKTSFAKLSPRSQANIRNENSFLMDIGVSPAMNAVVALAPGIQRALDDMEAELGQERRVAPIVQQLMEPIDPTIIPSVLGHARVTAEGWEAVKTKKGKTKEFFHSRVSLNIYRPNRTSLGDGSTTKGGIRYYVEASTLMKETVFKNGWNELNRLHASEEVMRQFIASYMRNSANNLAFLMFEKVNLLGLPLGGAKADVFIGNLAGGPGNFTIEDLDKNEKDEVVKKIAQRHGEILAPFVGIGTDSPAPDLNTAELMGILAEEYIKWTIKNKSEEFKDPELISLLELKLEDVENHPNQYPLGTTPLLAVIDDFGIRHPGFAVPWTSVFTGNKEFGGLVGREEATGIGVITVLIAYFQEMGIDYNNFTTAIQGMGAVGFNAALEALANHLRVTRFSDDGIAVINEQGWSEEQLINIRQQIRNINAEIRKHNEERSEENPQISWREFYLIDQAKPENERIFALPRVTAIINSEPKLLEDGRDNPEYLRLDQKIKKAILEAPVDVLIPAFKQNQIDQNNWENVTAPYIVEGANHPVDETAQRELTTKPNSTVILSGILANAGGVYGSYLQILQAMEGRKYDLEEVRRRSREKLTQVTKQVIQILRENPQLSFNQGCEFLAWRNAATERLKTTINETAGEMRKIRNYYGDAPAPTIMRRVVQLGLRDELIAKQKQSMGDLLDRIMTYLNGQRFKSGVNKMLRNEIKTTFLRSQNNDHAKTLFLIRTFYWILAGERVTESARRLEGFYYTVDDVIKLRRELLETLWKLPWASQSGTPENKLYLFVKERIEELNDAASLANGGIDFNMGHVLINQQGEDDFQVQAAFNRTEWEHIKGLKPIFLRLIPVNIPQLIGVQ